MDLHNYNYSCHERDSDDDRDLWTQRPSNQRIDQSNCEGKFLLPPPSNLLLDFGVAVPAASFMFSFFLEFIHLSTFQSHCQTLLSAFQPFAFAFPSFHDEHQEAQLFIKEESLAAERSGAAEIWCFPPFSLLFSSLLFFPPYFFCSPGVIRYRVW